ncbi:MAG: ParA family protein [Pseudomonadota bacterium]
MKSILVVNAKGGCGKTTLATNLASYYALWQVPVALLDCDPQQSSIDWLAQRHQGLNPIVGIDGSHGKTTAPDDIERMVIDAPARISPAQLKKLFDVADEVLLPVLPSPIDIRAVGHFVGELMMGDLLKKARVGIVANRVRENTRIFQNLEAFLKTLKLPVVTHLRDTQNYIKAAEGGFGVFEMAPYQVDKDMDQWRPLIKWVES